VQILRELLDQAPAVRGGWDMTLGHSVRWKADDPIGKSAPVSANWAQRVLLTSALFETEYLTRPSTLEHNHMSTATQIDAASLADRQPRQPSK